MNMTMDDVADYLEQWHKYDGYGMCLCVFHNDHSPSLSVSNHGFKCMSCGKSGTLEYLYKHVSGRVVSREKTYNPASYIWKKWFERFGTIENISKIANQNIKGLGLDLYLTERKVWQNVRQNKLGYLDGYYTFPIFSEYGEIQGMVARASPSIQTKTLRYTVSPNCPIKLYVPSWRNVLKADSLYVCYGIIDSLTLDVAGYAGLTGISGQELNAGNLDRFRKPMFIIPDKGEEKKSIELQTKLGWRAMPLFLDWPEGTKDLNGVHCVYGIEKVKELIEVAKRRYVYE
jgi:DNA primase